MLLRGYVYLLILVAVFAGTADAQTNTSEKSELSALFFGDYYWFINNHNSEFEGNNGFWIRRIYLTYDHRISESFSGRVRLEMSSEGDFSTNSALTPDVKDAYLRWQNDRHQITGGISPTPTWSLVEDVWEYRSIAKTPLDLHGLGNSRGLGVSFKGDIDKSGKLQYFFMAANGNGSQTELNRGKKFMLALSYQLNEFLVIQTYGDYEIQEGNNYIYTMQGFIGYRSEPLNWGILYAYQWRNNERSFQNYQQRIASAFTNFSITEHLSGIFRVDHLFDANPLGEEIAYIPFSDRAKSTFLLSGVDFQLHPDVHLMPNLITIFYGENDFNFTPDTDLIARMTLFFQL